MDGQPAVRVVRPRPLGLTDRIPVFWAGQEPTQELKQIDGGALYRHLVAASTPTGSKKRKRSHKYQAPKEGAPADHFAAGQEAQPQAQQPQQQPQEAGGAIHIPRVRLAPDYDLNQQAAAHHGPMIDGDIAAAPYLRHKEHPDIYDEHQPAEYDADEDDIAWLSNINSKNGQNGILAAAIGLYHQVSARISGSSEHAAGSEQPGGPQQQAMQPLRLSLDDFERAIDLLELRHFAAVKSWWEEEQEGPSSSAARVPTIPAMKALLPRAAALEALSGLLPDRKLAAQVLDYWLKKRAEEGGPLLERLWFEQPWKLVAFAHEIVDDDEDFDENLPFMAVEPRSKQKKSRRGGQRRKLSEEDVLEALYSLRNELETVRTLADQVRKREKLKRQLVVISQQEWQTRRQLALPPGPTVKTGRKSAAAAAAGPLHAGAADRGTAAAAAGAASGRAGAAAGAASMQSPPGSPKTELNKALARVALAAATAASPHGDEKARQTRTFAAAAAAEYELAFTAKRRRLLANNPAVAAAAAAAAADPSVAPAAEQKGAAAAAAAANGAPAVRGRNKLSKQERRPADQAVAAAGDSLQVQPVGRRGRGATAAAAAATAGDADESVHAAVSGPSSSSLPSPSPVSSDSEDDEDYQLEEEGSEDADALLASEADVDVEEEPAGTVADTGPPPRRQRQQRLQGKVLQDRQGRQQPQDGRARPSVRAAAAAAARVAAAQLVAEDSSSDDFMSDDSISQGGRQQVQGRLRSRAGRKGSQGSQRQQQDRQQHKQQLLQQQHQGGVVPKDTQQQRLGKQGPPPIRGSRRNGFVLPAMASSSELAGEGDAGSESDSATQIRKKRRPTVHTADDVAPPPPPAAAAGRRSAAAAATQPADAPPVLRPHNQQPKQLRSHTDSHKAAPKSPRAAPAAAGAVAASSGRGAVPVSAGNKGQGGGSVRRSSAGVAAAGHKAEVHRRRQRPPASHRGIGKAELRALGLTADAGGSQPRRKGH